MKKSIVSVLVLVLIAMAAGCSFSFGKAVASTSWASTSPDSFTKEVELDDKGQPFAEVDLTIDVDLSGGTLAWELYGPENNLLLTDSTEDKCKQTITVDPASGPWKLVVTATEVSGSLSFSLNGSK